jgi:hypothetical protein
LPTPPPAPKVSAPAVAAPVVAPALAAVPVSVEQPALPKLPPAPVVETAADTLDQVAVAPATQAVAGVAGAGTDLVRGTLRTAAAAVQLDESVAVVAGVRVARMSASAPQRSNSDDVVPASSAGQQSTTAQPEPAPVAAVSAPGSAPAAGATSAQGELSTAPAEDPASPQRLVAAPERLLVFSRAGRRSPTSFLTTFGAASVGQLSRTSELPAESTPPAAPSARPSRQLPPLPGGAAVTSSTAAGGAAAALLLLMCLTSFLLAAPPLRRWLRRQHGLGLPSVLLAPLENPG